MEDHIFISYAREDEDFALKLAGKLKDHGLKVWIDQWEMITGDDWPQKIRDAIYTCNKFLIILSPSSVDSTDVREEILQARNARKVILPVLYKEVQRMPYGLATLQYENFTPLRAIEEEGRFTPNWRC